MTRQLSRSHCILHFRFRSLFTLFYFSTLRFLGWFINPELCETRVHMFMVGTDISLPTALPDESQHQRERIPFSCLWGALTEWQHLKPQEWEGLAYSLISHYCPSTVLSLTFSGFFLNLHYPVFHIQLLNPIWIFRIVLSSVSFSKRFSKPIFCF